MDMTLLAQSTPVKKKTATEPIASSTPVTKESAAELDPSPTKKGPKVKKSKQPVTHSPPPDWEDDRSVTNVSNAPIFDKKKPIEQLIDTLQVTHRFCAYLEHPFVHIFAVTNVVMTTKGRLKP